MKTIFRLQLVAVVASLLFISALAQAQNTPPRYKDVVVDNPTAEAGQSVTGDWLSSQSFSNYSPFTHN